MEYGQEGNFDKIFHPASMPICLFQGFPRVGFLVREKVGGGKVPPPYRFYIIPASL
jgi:hypothetical protein